MFVEEKKQGEVQVPPLEKWRQDLLDAANLIERWGWWNGWGSRNDKHCAVTALQTISAVDLEAYARLLIAVRLDYKLKFQYVPQWNDASTKEIVVAKMREVARCADRAWSVGNYWNAVERQ